MARLTVFTPTFNRANTLQRVYQSLIKQTYRDFEWLIIDDGSKDNTKSVVEEFISDNCFAIRYVYQENQGKHIATNHAIQITQSELFVIADSDDLFVANALERLVETWDSIPDQQKHRYKGVTCQCFDVHTGLPIGKFPAEVFDSNDLDANFVHKLNFEKWMLICTEVLREFPFPVGNKGMKFFPETVVWHTMARKYMTRYINDPLRGYYRDQDNALTNTSTTRFRENIFLWEHFVNDIIDYFWYRPSDFLKSFVGLNRDNIMVGKSFFEIIQIPNRLWKKFICVLLYPIGVLLSVSYVIKHRDRNG